MLSSGPDSGFTLGLIDHQGHPDNRDGGDRKLGGEQGGAITGRSHQRVVPKVPEKAHALLARRHLHNPHQLFLGPKRGPRTQPEGREGPELSPAAGAGVVA